MPYVSQVYSIFGFSVPVDPDEIVAMIEQNVEVDFVERGGGGFTILAKLRYYETGQRHFEGVRGGRVTFTADVPDDEIARQWVEFTNRERITEQSGVSVRSRLAPRAAEVSEVTLQPVSKALPIARKVVAENLRDIFADPNMSDTAMALLAAPYLDGSRDADHMVVIAEKAARAAMEG